MRMVPAATWADLFIDLLKQNCRGFDWDSLQPDAYFLRRYTKLLDHEDLLPLLPAPTWNADGLSRAFQDLHDAASTVFQECEQQENAPSRATSFKRAASGLHQIVKRMTVVLKALGIEIQRQTL